MEKFRYGRDLYRFHLVQPLHKGSLLQTYTGLLMVLSRQVLNVSIGGESTAL